MTPSFFFELNPSTASYGRLIDINAANPFQTESYASAQRQLGLEPVIVGVQAGEQWEVAVSGFIRKGRLSRTLALPSVPPVNADSQFWKGLLSQCRKWRVSDLELESFACFSAVVPAIPGEILRTKRLEFFLDLQGADPASLLSKNHRHSIKRARATGLDIRRSTAPDALAAHVHLVDLALERHRNKGEEVHGGGSVGVAPLLESGSGEIFQALKDDTVLSSALVISSDRGAYYYSAGTHPDGLSCGASQFLVHSISIALQQEGRHFFFLGGTNQLNSGVAMFKSSFGATRVELESVSAHLGNKALKKLSTFLRASLQGRAWVRPGHLHVYSIDPASLDLSHPSDLRMEKLDDKQIKQLPQEFGQNVERLERYGFNDAYAFFRDDRIVHVAWLIPADHDRRRQYSVLDLRSGEAEIAHCATAAEYRGQNIYPQAIRALARLASQTGIQRLYMVVAPGNAESIRGIRKTGNWRRSLVFRVVRRFGRGGQFVLYRGHRWG